MAPGPVELVGHLAEARHLAMVYADDGTGEPVQDMHGGEHELCKEIGYPLRPENGAAGCPSPEDCP